MQYSIQNLGLTVPANRGHRATSIVSARPWVSVKDTSLWTVSMLITLVLASTRSARTQVRTPLLLTGKYHALSQMSYEI